MRKYQNPSPRSTAVLARKFYLIHGAPELADHCRLVIHNAENTDVLPVTKKTWYNRGNLADRTFSHQLRTLIWFHPIEYEKVCNLDIKIPQLLYFEELMRELRIFSELTRLEHDGRPLNEFVSLLNSSQAPLALLAKIADWTTTHEQQGVLIMSPDTATLSPFRSYPDSDSVLAYLRNGAEAARDLWVPTAELFGLPNAAGRILTNVYLLTLPELSAEVSTQLNDPDIRDAIRLTRLDVNYLKKTLICILSAAGYDVEVTMRIKHKGKCIHKLLRLAREIYDAKNTQLANDGSLSTPLPPFEVFFNNLPEKSNLRKINDHVALRVEVIGFKGKKLKSMSELEQNAILSVVIELVHGTARTLSQYTIKSPEDRRKPNGYHATHIDSVPNGISRVGFEIQIMTREEFMFQRYGGAGRALYLGGNPDVLSQIKNLYLKIIHRYDSNHPSELL